MKQHILFNVIMLLLIFGILFHQPNADLVYSLRYPQIVTENSCMFSKYCYSIILTHMHSDNTFNNTGNFIDE